MLRPVYESYQHFYVVNEKIELPVDMIGRTYFIRHSERDWLFLANLWEAWRILRHERPTLLLSAGAGPIVPFALVGKLLGIHSIYVENAGQVRTPSLTGRVMYRLADRFFYQWPGLKGHFPRGTYGGPLPWCS
jgi:UDP-N-acetylglucosamine:LPS N-acetylglucosamine transferase